jgi:phytol kinase
VTPGAPPPTAPTSPAPPAAPLALRHELARKSIHLTSATAPAAYALGVPAGPALAILLGLAATALAVELARHRSAAVRSAFTRLFGPVLREHEHGALSGATWMLLAFALAVALYPRPVAVAAMWGVSVGDAAAAVIGRWSAAYRRSVAGRKTIAGTTACFVATLAGALLLAHLPPLPATTVAVAAAAAERATVPWFDDNLRIVVAVGAAWALLSALGITGIMAIA